MHFLSFVILPERVARWFACMQHPVILSESEESHNVTKQSQNEAKNLKVLWDTSASVSVTRLVI